MPVIAQILLSVVILTATFLLAVVGFQVFQVLSEFKTAVKRLNTILANTQTLSQASAKPVAAVNQFFSEVKTLVNQTQDEIISSTPDRVITPSHHHSNSTPTEIESESKQISFSVHKPRFFRRSGSPLRPS